MYLHFLSKKSVCHLDPVAASVFVGVDMNVSMCCPSWIPILFAGSRILQKVFKCLND